MYKDEIQLVTDLRKRAEIRRSIPRGEPDRIADQLEAAATMIEKVADERDFALADLRECS